MQAAAPDHGRALALLVVTEGAPAERRRVLRDNEARLFGFEEELIAVKP